MGCVIHFACNYDPNATAYVPGVVISPACTA